MKLICPVFARALLGALCLFSSSLRATENPPADPVAARVLQLRAEIARHDEFYFKKAAPIISDSEYDALKRELRELERRLTAKSDLTVDATANGDDRSGLLPTARHEVPVLGLEKSHSEAELRKFVAHVERALGDDAIAFVVEPKYDGLSISVTYEHGRLARAVTRGDGQEGDDVTANLLECAKVPTALKTGSDPVPARVELRGEVFMRQEEFERLNAERRAAGLEPFAHPRNLAVGTLKAPNAAERAGRKLEVVFYGWGVWRPLASEPASQRELLERILRWGLPAPEWARGAVGADAIWREVRVIEATREKLGFPIDGAVVKIDAVAQRRRLGETERAPNWAIAHKFDPERVATRLRGITLQVGRTGAITPVAELEPVLLSGARVARASLNNREEIARRDLRVGDTVFVARAGEIIPVITGVDSTQRAPDAKPFVFPAHCPSCKAMLVAADGQATVRCPNRSCRAQVQRRLEFFASDDCADLRGFGPGVIEKLVQRGLLREPADFFRLSETALQDAVGTKTAAKLRAAVERARPREAWRFLLGLGVAGVGPAAAKALANRFGDLESVAQAPTSELSDGRVSRIAGVSDAAAAALADFLAGPDGRAELLRLHEAIKAH